MPESVIVDLSGMKKILSINRTQRMTVIEPGVTYGELQTALEKEGLTLSTSIAPRATKSVVASALELEPRLKCSAPVELYGSSTVYGSGGGGMATGCSPVKLEWAPGPREAVGRRKVADRRRRSEHAGFLPSAYCCPGNHGHRDLASLKCEILPKIQKMVLVPPGNLRISTISCIESSGSVSAISPGLETIPTSPCSSAISDPGQGLAVGTPGMGGLGRHCRP